MYRYTILLPAFLLLSGCGGDGGGEEKGNTDQGGSITPKSVAINFNATIGDEALDCGSTYHNVGAGNSDLNVKDFRFYVHNLRLVTDTGTEVSMTLDSNVWQAQGVALLDFEDATGSCTGNTETHTAITGSVPDDSLTFTGLRFTVGIPEELNHLEQATVSPFNVINLNWGWTSGYKFMRLDVIPNGGVDLASWNFHLGSQNCSLPANSTVATCQNSNRAEISLNNFDTDKNSVRLDYGALVLNNDIGTDTGGNKGCMSGLTDPECNEIFTQLGLDLATGENAFSQHVFSVVWSSGN